MFATRFVSANLAQNIGFLFQPTNKGRRTSIEIARIVSIFSFYGDFVSASLGNFLLGGIQFAFYLTNDFAAIPFVQCVQLELF